ncbi:predicted protein [Histoplasma capsulatum var. duboisii H88]|uniref:Predicted protein n=1 Tax=Ajellomyces capsulatus (strain H88) TaxID=544711 RepID=F0UDH6_AJEC8|nr:predicted protein [Histoplasma capsulatum var. duboisii H88]
MTSKLLNTLHDQSIAQPNFLRRNLRNPIEFQGLDPKGMDDHWSTGALEHWSTGALEHWSTGALEHWSTGALEHWSTGALEHWSTGALEHWSPAAKDRNFGTFPAVIRLEPATAVRAV